MKSNLIYLLALCLFILPFMSCNKFLDKKPDKTLSTISTLADAQSLLEQYTYLSQKDVASSEISAGDFYLNETDLSSREEYNRRLYLWQNDNLYMEKTNDWYNTYYVVFVANTVIKALQSFPGEQRLQSDFFNTLGQAYYFRARAMMSGAYTWCLAYDSTRSGNEMGLPLRLDPDFNTPSERATLEATYRQIEKDLLLSASLLPTTSVHVLRPNKVGAMALLARLYLSMGKYTLSGRYTDSALLYNSYLMDYNDASLIPSTAAAYPMPQFNKEVISDCRFVSTMLLNSRARIDSILYRSYASNDLRKLLFFKVNNDGTVGFKGSYSKSSFLNTSVCTDEMYLTRAECNIRNGNTAKGISDLNTLLLKRWKKGTYTPLSESLPSDTALSLVLLERRKELLMRGIRWMDIKRLNKEGYNIGLTRSYNGSTYLLEAGSPRFALPIPDEIIRLSGMKQNPY